MIECGFGVNETWMLLEVAYGPILFLNLAIWTESLAGDEPSKVVEHEVKKKASSMALHEHFPKFHFSPTSSMQCYYGPKIWRISHSFATLNLKCLWHVLI